MNLKKNNKSLQIIGNDILLYQVCRSICKIIVPIQNSWSPSPAARFTASQRYLAESAIIRKGFLIQLYKGDNIFYCLMIYENSRNKTIIEQNHLIQIYYDYENKMKEIILNKKERYIENINNILIIEILDSDNINEDYFLFPCLDYYYSNNKNIYIPFFYGENKINKSFGEILEVDNYGLFRHNSSMDKNSSGSPIFLQNTIKVIGIAIYNGGIPNKKENYGIFIYPIINLLSDKIIYNKNQYEGGYINDKFEGKGKYIYENGDLYIGEWKRGLREGNGILYYKNGNIKYEGGWVNDKYEGNGKHIWKDGECYIGGWKNGLKNGKGVFYYKNGSIEYEGDWVNDKYEGKGKYIWEDGEFYIGEWKNDLMNGKGKLYYKNGYIKYEGEWVNDKYEGNGNFIWEDGDYYIGEWKNGQRNGKGKLFYKNGTIRYEGDWASDKYEKIGTYFWEDGEFYKGEWKSGLRNGKGILYDKNGNIKYESLWLYGQLIKINI